VLLSCTKWRSEVRFIRKMVKIVFRTYLSMGKYKRIVSVRLDFYREKIFSNMKFKNKYFIHIAVTFLLLTLPEHKQGFL
jgi:hypothetical protein